jgi:hypothetical protein
MSMITPTDKGKICSICLEDFLETDEKVSHEGATHDGFHEQCFLECLESNRFCPDPYCRQPIDTSSLISRIEQILKMLSPVLGNTVCTTLLSIAGAGALAGEIDMHLAGDLILEGLPIEFYAQQIPIGKCFRKLTALVMYCLSLLHTGFPPSTTATLIGDAAEGMCFWV